MTWVPKNRSSDSSNAGSKKTDDEDDDDVTSHLSQENGKYNHSTKCNIETLMIQHSQL